MKCGRRHRAKHRLEFRRRAERVAAALDDQHVPLDRRQMFVAALLRLSRRMQRIPEQRDSLDRKRRIGRRDVRRDPAAHRFSADEEMTRGAIQLCVNRGHHRVVARLEDRLPVRNAPPRLGVWKVEGDDIDAERREGTREFDEERAVLPGPGAVPKHDRRKRRPGRAAVVDARGRGRRSVQRNRQLMR